MKCKEVKYLLPDYAKNKLGENEQLELLGHLEKCRKCAEEKTAIQTIFRQIEIEKIAQPSEIYWTNLLPRIHERISGKKKSALWEIASRAFIPAVTAIVATFILIRVFTFDYSKVEQTITTAITDDQKELSSDDAVSLGREGLFLVDYLEMVENKSSSSDVLQKIMLEANNIFESDHINIQTAIYTLNDDEINNLLAILEEDQIN